MKIDFLSPATAEFKDAIAHYNLQSEGLGFEFAAEEKENIRANCSISRSMVSSIEANSPL